MVLLVSLLGGSNFFVYIKPKVTWSQNSDKLEKGGDFLFLET